MRKHVYSRMFKLALALCFTLILALPALAQSPASATKVDGLGRVLVAYYSFTGNTAKVAVELCRQTGGDIYAIEPAEAYAQNPREQIKAQREQGQWPALKNPPPNFSAYDTVIVGAPVWGGDVPPPMVTFLNQADLSGKNVAYFGTSAARPREFMAKFKACILSGEIIGDKDFGEIYKDDAALSQAVTSWLNAIKLVVNP